MGFFFLCWRRRYFKRVGTFVRHPVRARCVSRVCSVRIACTHHRVHYIVYAYRKTPPLLGKSYCFSSSQGRRDIMPRHHTAASSSAAWSSSSVVHGRDQYYYCYYYNDADGCSCSTCTVYMRVRQGVSEKYVSTRVSISWPRNDRTRWMIDWPWDE